MKEIPENPVVAVLGGAGEMGRKAVSIVSQIRGHQRIDCCRF